MVSWNVALIQAGPGESNLVASENYDVIVLGGGVTGIPGHNAARKIIRDLA